MNNNERIEYKRTGLAEERMSEVEKKASRDMEYYQKRWKEVGLKGELYLDTAGNGVEYIFGNINGQDIYLCKKQGTIDGRPLTEDQVYAIYEKYADIAAPTKNMKQAEKEIIEALRKQPRTEEEILQKKKEEELMMQKEEEQKKQQEELEAKKTQMMVDRILR
jgi:hypothetical protein